MKLREIKLLEGGNALAQAGVGRIDKKYVPSTVEFVGKLAGIPKRDLHPLGSTGKNPTSGDIDLGIDSGKYPPEHVHRRLMTRIGDDSHHTYNSGTKIHSYAIPVVKRVGEEFVEVGGNVQVDLIYSPSVDWAKFAHHSEGQGGSQTSYKGAVRTILLKSVAAVYSEPGIDMMVFDPKTEQLIIRVGRTLDLTHGLRRIFQFRAERKDPNHPSPYVKGMRTVHTIEELQPTLNALKKKYPGHFDDVELDVADHEIVVNDPAKALKMIFPGGPVNPNDVRTAEQVLDLISSRFPPDMQVKILHKAKDALEDLSGQMRTPDIDAYIEHAEKKGEESK